jgi:hypothetical protein
VKTPEERIAKACCDEFGTGGCRCWEFDMMHGTKYELWEGKILPLVRFTESLAADAKRARVKLQESEANRIGTVKGLILERNEAQRLADEAREDLNEVKDQLAAAWKKNAELNRRAQANESSWMAACKERDQAVADAKRAREEVKEVQRAWYADARKFANAIEEQTARGLRHVSEIRSALTRHSVDEQYSVIELAALRMTQIDVLTQERDQAIERAEKERASADALNAEINALHERHHKQQTILKSLIDQYKMPVKLGHMYHAETVRDFISHLAPSVAGQQKRADKLAADLQHNIERAEKAAQERDRLKAWLREFEAVLGPEVSELIKKRPLPAAPTEG